MKIYYRISDNSYPKPRFGDKRRCLDNFLSVFAPAADELVIVADNCQQPTIEMIRQACNATAHPLSDEMLHRTSLGNSGSFRYVLQQAAALPGNHPVYLLEDDYLHLPGSREMLLEGLSLAPYVTLYDMPDKYVPPERGGNPFVQNGGEPTRVLRSRLSHWKLTNSTTMTFASTSDVLRADQGVWVKHSQDNHPRDFQAFLELNRNDRALIVCLPGKCTHCDPYWPSPGVDWDLV